MRFLNANRKMLKLFKKQFMVKENIVNINEADFSLRLTECIRDEYVRMKTLHSMKNDNEYLAKLKLALNVQLNVLEGTKSEFKYSAILITTLVTSLTFGTGLLMNLNSNYITKILDNKLKGVTDPDIIENVNGVILSINSSNLEIIKSLTIGILIGVGILAIVYQAIESTIKRQETYKYSFYKLCYDVISDIEARRI